MKITILSPHRDDAAFSVGLAIGRWIEAGHKVEVVNCFTRSEYSPFGEKELVHANDLRTYVTALRLKEDLRWTRMYHPPVMLRDLNLRDAPQRRNCTVDEVCTLPVKDDDPALEKIAKALGEPGRQALVLPLALGNHVDHLTARRAAEAACGAEVPVAFYEDLPYAARPDADEGIEARAGEVGRAFGRSLQAGFASAPADVDGAVKRKRRLALCYDSQIDDAVTNQIAEFCVRYGGRERLWRDEAWVRLEELNWRE